MLIKGDARLPSTRLQLFSFLQCQTLKTDLCQIHRLLHFVIMVGKSYKVAESFQIFQSRKILFGTPAAVIFPWTPAVPLQYEEPFRAYCNHISSTDIDPRGDQGCARCYPPFPRPSKYQIGCILATLMHLARETQDRYTAG